MPPRRTPADDDADASKASEINWEVLFPKSATTSAVYKASAVLSLMAWLHLSPRQFLDWFFSTEQADVKKKAAQCLSPKGGISPLSVWLSNIGKRFSGGMTAVEDAIDPFVKAILLRESNAAIQCRDLSIRPGDIGLPDLLARVGSGEENVSSRIQELMPRSVSWLLHATSAGNAYRSKKKRQQSASQDGAQMSDVLEDSSLDGADVEGDGEGPEFCEDGLSWHTEYPGFSRNPYMAVVFVLSILLFVRNRSTNAFPFLLGVQMITHGASTRIMTTFSCLGAVVSARTLDRFRERISLDAVTRAINAITDNPLWLWIIDNINLFIRRAAQRITKLNYMINATNAALIFLPSSIRLAALDYDKFVALQGKRADAEPKDIRPTPEDDSHMISAYEALVEQFLIAYCPGADKWADRGDMKARAVSAMPSVSPLAPEVTKTFPVGVLDANEGSYKGLIKAIELLRQRLRMTSSEWAAHLRIGAGDYLTSRNIRGAQYIRQYDLTAAERLETILPQSQLFHFAMRAADVIHSEHLGDSVNDPGSLSRQKDQLRRTYDVNKVDYANAKALIRHSLIARILHCVMVEKGFGTWAALSKWRPTYADVQSVAKTIVRQYSTFRAAEKAQAAHDDVLAHSIHFIMEALRFCEFESAVSHGDAGRILIVLKYWAFDFRGAGSHNYARECVEILLRWKYELDNPMREMWAASWFINRRGLPGRFIASDLYLEQLNYYVKVVHKADGSGANIYNIIAKGSSCIEALSQISEKVGQFVGIELAHRRHKEANFNRDLEVLVRNMHDASLHTLTRTSHRSLPKPPKKAAKEPKGLQVPSPPESTIKSLFGKGFETWNGKWQEFIDDTTWEPALGPAAEQLNIDSGSVPLGEEDLGIVADGGAEPVCDGIGGVGGLAEYDGGPTADSN